MCETGFQREQAAGAGKLVNTAISARLRNITGALADRIEDQGEVLSWSDGGALRAVIWQVKVATGELLLPPYTKISSEASQATLRFLFKR